MIRMLLSSLAMTLSLTHWGALAQSYPAKPVKILVPFVAGGTSDIVARAVAQKLNEAGYTTVVENRPGANGSIAAEALAKSPNDGYILMVGSIGTFAINMGLYKNPKYDVMRDFDAVTVAVRTPNVLIVPPQFPANNLKEFIDYARKNPGKVSYGSSGSGSSDHLSAEMFKLQTQTFGVHIPYRGGAAAQTDIMAGNIEASFQNFGTVVPYIKAGRMKALGGTSRQRMPQLPDVPTLTEAGVPGADYVFWIGMLVTSKTPRDVVQKINQHTLKALQTPEVRDRLTTLGAEPMPLSPEQFDAMIRDELAVNAQIIKSAGIKTE